MELETGQFQSMPAGAMWAAALSLGDWRHPGVYAIVHIPTRLEYVGASACVYQRLKNHFGGGGWAWMNRLERQLDRMGMDRSTARAKEHFFPVWLETCSLDVDELCAREEYHYNTRRPALNSAKHVCYGGQDFSDTIRKRYKSLGVPPPSNYYDVQQVAVIRSALSKRYSIEEVQRAELAKTGIALRKAVYDLAFREAEAAFDARIASQLGEEIPRTSLMYQAVSRSLEGALTPS